MIQLRLFLFAFFIAIFSFSCSEDNNQFEDESTPLSSSSRDSDKEASQPSFYQFNYISDYLGIKSTDEEELKLSSHVLNSIYQWKIKGTIEYEITNQYGLPAWSLSKVDIKENKDYVTVLTPIFNMDSQSNSATIITKLGYDGALKKVHIYDQKKLSAERWAAFEPYFNELTNVVNGNPESNTSPFTRYNPCQDGMNCWCESDIGECTRIISGQLIMCNKKCPLAGGGTDGEEEAPNGTDNTEGGSNNGTSSNSNWSDWDWESVWPPIINPNNISWIIFQQQFNGDLIDNDEGSTFTFPEDGDGSDIADPDTGTENIMDPQELYYIQMQGFINHYNLTMSVDELAAMLPNDPESCAGLLAQDFYNCARYHLTSDLVSDYNLQLTEKEKWYLFNNFEIYENITNFLAIKGNTPYARASTSIYLGLGDAALLDLTYSQAYNPSNANKLRILISDKLEAFGLDDQASVDPSTWYMMIKKEASKIGGYFTDAFLNASEKAVNKFWNDIVSPVRDVMAPVLEEIGDQIPTTNEEWQALMAVFGPMLLELGVDVGTDLIPVVGELKALYKCGDAALAGHYGDAAIEFVCGLAGIIPIGDLLVKSGKIVKAGAAIFTAFKVIKALSKVSKNIFSKLIEYAQLGWKIAWDSGLKKMTFKNGDQVVGTIDKNGVPDITSNIFKSIADVESIKTLVSKTLINSSKSNKISKEFIDEFANKFNITSGPLKNEIDDIILNGDPTGTKTEYLMNEIFKDAGYTLHDGSYGPIDIFGRGMNGFDGVYIKGSLDNPIEIIVNESKQFNANNANYVSLNKGTDTNPAQMTDAWVDKVIDELESAGKLDVAEAIKKARDPNHPASLTKIVSVVDATPSSNSNGLLGGVSIIKVD